MQDYIVNSRALWCGPWFLVGNGGMDPYSSPYVITNIGPQYPFPHSLLRTRQLLRTLNPYSITLIVSLMVALIVALEGTLNGTLKGRPQ